MKEFNHKLKEISDSYRSIIFEKFDKYGVNKAIKRHIDGKLFSYPFKEPLTNLPLMDLVYYAGAYEKIGEGLIKGQKVLFDNGVTRGYGVVVGESYHNDRVRIQFYFTQGTSFVFKSNLKVVSEEEVKSFLKEQKEKHINDFFNGIGRKACYFMNGDVILTKENSLLMVGHKPYEISPLTALQDFLEKGKVKKVYTPKGCYVFHEYFGFDV